MELLEREQHLDQLEEHLRQAAAGHGRLVLVGGEAGVGKTTLVDEFCRQRRRDGGGAADLVRRALHAGSARSRTRPGSGARPPHRPAPPSTATRVTGSSGRCWRPSPRDRGRRSSSPKTPIGPTAPRSSCCASSAGGSGICPSSSSSPTATTRSGPITPCVWSWAIWRQRQPSTASASARCRKRRCSRWPTGSGRDAATLHRLTGGNPFFVTEVLAAEGETVPATVGDAVLARAARLSPEARAVLDVAAVIGSTIDAEPLADRRRAGPRRSRRVYRPRLAAGNRRRAGLQP